MTDILDKIDTSLEEVEEQLLAEYNQSRKRNSTDRYVTVDEGIRNTLSEVVNELHGELKNSGDHVKLSLITEQHEILYSRIAVLKQLMAAKVPMAFLQEVREGVDIRRRSLEKRVFAQRKQDDQNRNRTPGGVSNIFDHRPSEQSIERNRFQITAQEEAQQRGERAFLDNGIYSASRELAMLASLIRGGTLDEPPEKAERGRATFEARELTRKMPTVNKAPRIKVEEVQPPPTEAPKRDIAQTPEEIRRKLAARLEQRNAGKATFAARDIPHAASGDTPARKETPAAEPETPRSGKAVFGARDIEPAVPHGFYGRKKEEEEKKEDKPRNGRATFESRDLDSPFNKKD